MKQKEERTPAAARQAAAIARQNQAKVNKQLGAAMLAVARVRSNEFSAVGKRTPCASEAAARERSCARSADALLQSRAEERQGAEVEATAGLEASCAMEQELRLLRASRSTRRSSRPTASSSRPSRRRSWARCAARIALPPEQLGRVAGRSAAGLDNDYLNQKDCVRS